MRLTVRSAQADDEAVVAELWRVTGLVTDYNDPAADFRFALGGACSAVLVGEDEGGRICGSVMVGHDGHRGWIYYVAADPSMRNLGCGREMVEAAEEWLCTRHVVKVQLLVRDSNIAVVGFYKHLGYEMAPRTVLTKWLRQAG